MIRIVLNKLFSKYCIVNFYFFLFTIFQHKKLMIINNIIDNRTSKFHMILWLIFEIKVILFMSWGFD